MLNIADNIVFTDDLDAVHKNLFGKENSFCLIACLTGSVQLTRKGENFLIGKDEMAICRTDMLVGNYMRTPDFSGYLLSIDNKMARELMFEVCRFEPKWMEMLREIQRDPVMKANDERYKELMRSYFGLLKLYMNSEQNEYRKKTYMLLAKAASYEIIAAMHKKIIISNNNEEVYTAGDRIARDFIEMLRQDDGTHREVAWYAERLNITPKYLSYICKQKSNMTASAIIQQVTSERIKYYLLNSDMNIKEIAYKLQFPTVSFFCKYVHQHLHNSPLSIRKNKGI